MYSDVDGVSNTSADGGVTGVHGWGITPCVLWLHCVLDLVHAIDVMVTDIDSNLQVQVGVTGSM